MAKRDNTSHVRSGWLLQRLPIGKQLSVIYGHNASGKYGYARVMKKAFRARVTDDILPNVYVAAKAGSAPLHRQIETLERQDASLATARDLHLPRLMNGEVTV